MQSICVFCGSKPGNSPVFAEQARKVGEALAEQELTLIYGGATSGLMGEVADAALLAGGRVIGVMPSQLEAKERIHEGLSELIQVDDMASRKQKMLEISEGFIALPGGTGTLDEIFEMITLSQIGQHHKPCGFLNSTGFYQPLITFLKQMRDQGFLHPDYFAMLQVNDDPIQLLDQMRSFQHPHTFS